MILAEYFGLKPAGDVVATDAAAAAATPAAVTPAAATPVKPAALWLLYGFLLQNWIIKKL